MIKIQIDGIIYEVKEGRNLLETCIALGIDVPYFCYHGAMGSVGACRQCAVKKYANPNDKTGKIVMSCMEPVTDGMLVSVEDKDAADFRAGVVEGLMTNHPHDCPVCDEGGECHLQDMTVMTGHNYRRFVFKKRTYTNQYLGPFIQHEMNRCIQCYRCVRYYKDYAGGKDLNVYGSANQVYFGRQQEGTLESEFSGNLVEVCPTGVFTDKTLKKHYTRKWDLTNGPSICVHCSVGCNTILGERYGSLRRTLSRYHGDINGYFLCDRGRFGYEFIESTDRTRQILVRDSKNDAMTEIQGLDQLTGLTSSLQGNEIIGIGSPRASLEANFALSEFVGKDNFCHGISQAEFEMVKKALTMLGSGMAHVPSLKELEKCDAVLILGEDITNTAPMMALSVRQCIRNKSIRIASKMGIPAWNDSAVRQLNHEVKSPLFIASPVSTKLDDVATETWYAAPDDIARLGFAVASAIVSAGSDDKETGKSLKELASRISEALMAAENPLIVTGIAGGSMEKLDAVTSISQAFSGKNKKVSIAISFPESNSAGLGLMEGRHLNDVVAKIEKQPPEVLIILENDLYRKLPAEIADKILVKCPHVIVIDHMMHATALKADLVIPSAVYAESAGTMVNHEGRAQRYYSALPVKDPVKENWQWITDLMNLSGKNVHSWQSFDGVADSLSEAYPVFKGIKGKMPDAGFRYYNEKIARQTSRFSGRTAMNARKNVSEPAPPIDADSPMKFSMEGYKGYPPAELIPYYWSPGWNSAQSINKYLEEPDGQLRDGNPGVRLFDDAVFPGAMITSIVPKAFKQKTGGFLFIPVHRIFGSEELSAHAHAIAELIPKPFVLVSVGMASQLRLNEKSIYKISINGNTLEAVILTDPHIPDGIAGISVLLPEMPFIDLPAWGVIGEVIGDR
jgi:NADH-quinone oxidoreductase subunit G